MAEEGDVETVTEESMEYQSHPKEIFPESAINGTSTEHEVEPVEGETKSELDEVQEVVNEQEQQYWKTVLENPGDFTSWTYLLQFVEQENKLLSARKAFDSFFKRYPYCYGYWKKYADMERKNGNLDRAKEVFEQGIVAITYSVDLWVHYLNFSSQITKGQADGPQIMRSLFERAISTAGNDYRSDKLWDAFLEWEKSQGQLKKVTHIYDKLLTVPTQKYTQHFQKFKDHINSNPVAAVLSTEELLKLRSEVAASPPGVSTTEACPQVIEAGSKKKDSEDKDKKDDDDDDEVAPGTEDLIASGEDESPLIMSENDPETVAIREKVIAARAEAYAKLEDEIRKIWAYEEGIKRPYFHVKPLERVQLKNWKDYLDFEITNGNHDRVVILFERCVIACALYEEFWQKYAGYVEAHSLEKCHDVYERACTIHLPKKPNIHLSWAAFEEEQGNNNLAAKILEDLDAGVPDLALVKLRRINLERRRENFDKVSTIYEEAIEGTEDTSVKSFYAVRCARFLSKVAGNEEQAFVILKDCIEKDKGNKRLYLQLLDLALNQRPVSEERVEEVFDLIKNTDLDTDIKQEFSQRRLEFLEDFSSSITKLMKANEAHSKLYKAKSSNLNGITSGKKRASESSNDNKAKSLKADDGVSDTTLAYQTTTPTVTEVYDSTYSTAYSAAAAAYSYAATPVHNQWAAAGYASTQPAAYAATQPAAYAATQPAAYAATQPAAYAATQPAAYAATQPAAYNYNQWYYGQQVPTTPSM